MRLGGAHVVVTGASRGIGASLVRELTGRGARVTMLARSREPLEALAAEVGGNAIPVDLAAADRVEGLIGRIEQEHGPVDGLVNNAAIGDVKPFVTMSESAITQGITANLIAPMMLTHQALVGMRARRRGAIAMVSSVAGEFASRNAAPYGASKAGLTMFTTTLQRELRREPIDLMLVILGEVQTAMLDQVRADPVMSQIGKRVGKMRSLTPQEVAHGMADGIERGRARLIMPTAASGLVMLRNVPTRVMDAALIGVD